MASDMKQLLKSFDLNAVSAREDQDLLIANTSGKPVPITWERPFVGQLPQADTKLHLNFSSKTLACSAQWNERVRPRSPVLKKKGIRFLEGAI